MQEHRVIHYPVCNSDLTYPRDTNIFNFTLPVITAPLIYRGGACEGSLLSAGVQCEKEPQKLPSPRSQLELFPNKKAAE